MQSEAAGRLAPGVSSGREIAGHEGGLTRLAGWVTGFVRGTLHSLTVKLVVIVGIFLALPILLYGQFQRADAEKQALVMKGVQEQSRLIAEALGPLLDQPDAPKLQGLEERLHTFAADGMSLKLLFRPNNVGNGQRYYLIAAAPSVPPERLQAGLDELLHLGILTQLDTSCTGNEPLAIRHTTPSGREELLTSLIPIQTRWGCWALITAHGTSEFLGSSIGQSYWQTPEVRLAAVIYLVVGVLAGIVAFSIWRSLRRMRQVAGAIVTQGIGGASFAEQNRVPELASVATDFDRLVMALHGVAETIRRTAEDNAHALKTPLATIRHALEPLRRAVGDEQPRSRRAIDLIETSVARLETLVLSAQHLDSGTADLIEAPRTVVNLTELVAETLIGYRETLAAREISLIQHLAVRAPVRVAAGVVETALQNVLDNAISFTPRGGTLIVTLRTVGRMRELLIEDDGPGVDLAALDRIFDRYFSLRPNAEEPSEDGQVLNAVHSGLGLWIVRRNIEAMGGRVEAYNRPGGGLAVRILLGMAA